MNQFLARIYIYAEETDDLRVAVPSQDERERVLHIHTHTSSLRSSFRFINAVAARDKSVNGNRRGGGGVHARNYALSGR